MVKSDWKSAAVPRGERVERYPSLGEAAGRFLDDLALTSVSPRTPRTYKDQLWQFLPPVVQTRGKQRAWSPDKLHDQPLSYLTEQTCRELVGLRLRFQSRNTARTFGGVLAAFCTWADATYGYPSPMAKIPVPKAPRTPHRYLSAEQVRAVYQACPDAEYRAMVLLLLEGVRAAELLAVRWSDVGDTIRIHGKGDKPRRIAVSRLLGENLSALRQNGRDGPFPFSYPILNKRVSKLGRAAGIAKLTPHVFRKTWASQAMLAGLDVPTVVTLGGWSDDRVLKRVYAATVVEEAALAKARELALTDRLLGR